MVQKKEKYTITLAAESLLFPFGNASIPPAHIKEPKVACMVVTTPKYHMLRAVHVMATWGRHCNWIVFLTSKRDPLLREVIITPSEDENYDRLWWKVSHGFKMVHSKYLDMADFFVKADDDTYIVMENLKHFIMAKDLMGLEEPLYMGLHLFPLPNYESLKKDLPKGFFSGGNGYILNKAALDLLVKKGLGPSGDCHQLEEHHGEDVAMGHCMTSLGAKFVDTDDPDGRHRFVPYLPHVFLPSSHLPVDGSWMESQMPAGVSLGLQCCSPELISIHYVPSNIMYLLEYLLYHVRVAGVHGR
ncbi:unnamed protein product [Darwinula stevensoni]|uniref:N-acetylgalactosaminide beta-1,3-galactosyltransferase n=1 Tax=Darwinula stevensoni TaxID=69355 RepID=A0A7R9AEL1_9CRUS|nr:unnamed protein product [Darwinula stevensoni]CAG0902423.1 unnamed protein product [Darwinula stevensoni]